MRTLIAITLASTAIASGVHAQGTFVNLNFEATTVPMTQPPTDPGPPVDVGAAFPGWSAFLGTNQLSKVWYNNYTIGTANISLITPITPPFPAIEGNYSALLQAGVGGPAANIPMEASLRQTSLIPLNAQSIQFKAILDLSGVNPPFTVSLGGQNLALATLQQTPAYTLYGADVTAFAGQYRELRFTVTTPDGRLNNLYLDAIRFGPAIPEPGTTALLAFGAACILRSLKRPRAKWWDCARSE